MEILKVSSKTKVSSLAGAIAEIIRTENSTVWKYKQSAPER